ncbi:MAG: hypothetical protein OEW19_13240, partial [Acidobacteriota bacterium]|nr:hypothetical protein [Acidobacteriota bacterium]
MKTQRVRKSVVALGTACLVVAGAASGTRGFGPSPAVSTTPPPDAQPAATPPPDASAPGEPSAATRIAPAVGIYMPDGQLKSHSIRVYVTKDIQLGQNPRLRLLRSHAVTRKAVDEAALLEPGLVAPGQEWVESVDDQQVRRSGTLLLFD